MVTTTLTPEEVRRLRIEFEENIARPGQRIPDIMAFDMSTIVTETKPSIRGIPLRMVESTLNRIWGDETAGLNVKGFDELWRPDKPEVALIHTNAGDRVLKTEKQQTGQSGIVNEGVAQLFYAQLNLRSIRMGVDGLKRRD